DKENLVIISKSNLTIIKKLKVAYNPFSFWNDALNNKLHIASPGYYVEDAKTFVGEVSVLNTNTWTVEATLATRGYPSEYAYDSTRQWLFIGGVGSTMAYQPDSLNLLFSFDDSLVVPDDPNFTFFAGIHYYNNLSKPYLFVANYH